SLRSFADDSWRRLSNRLSPNERSFLRSSCPLVPALGGAVRLVSGLAGRVFALAVVMRDGLASRTKRTDANRGILRVCDIEVIGGSTFSKFFFRPPAGEHVREALGKG